ncbi:MAG: IclR family transcriptional regulator [Meiothermus sp.]|nr:IclR family transcriptional regulator [Meiothermus sp.]
MNSVLSDRTPEAEPPTNSASDKLLRVLSAFGVQPSWEVAGLATHLELPKSTTHRLLQDLRRHGYVRQIPGSARYTLGYRMALLAHSASPAAALREIVRPSLEHLAAITGETASFIVADDLSALVLEVVESPSALRFALSPGTRFPLHRGSAGRVFLAFGEADGRAKATAVLDPAERSRLEREIVSVRAQGWAYTANEVNLGAAAVAVPVLNAGVLVGCLAAGGPVTRMGPEVAQGLVSSLLGQAEAITKELGG